MTGCAYLCTPNRKKGMFFESGGLEVPEKNLKKDLAESKTCLPLHSRFGGDVLWEVSRGIREKKAEKDLAVKEKRFTFAPPTGKRKRRKGDDVRLVPGMCREKRSSLKILEAWRTVGRSPSERQAIHMHKHFGTLRK